jgi:hypothetical protein
MSTFNKKGQNMAEDSILIALVIAAAIGIKVYVQRGMQARIHDESDALVDAISNNTNVTAAWNEISNATVTAEKQFEPSDFAKKSTTVTAEDTEAYTLNKEGTTNTAITRNTTQAQGDYEQYNYNKTQ